MSRLALVGHSLQKQQQSGDWVAYDYEEQVLLHGGFAEVSPNLT